MTCTVLKDAWAFRVVAIQRLVYPGGPIDQLFPWNGSEARNYTDTLYQSGEASAFLSNYFEPNLQRRGLIDSTFGPKIKTGCFCYPRCYSPFYDPVCTVVLPRS